jgi:hypothetical protein
MVMRTFAVLLVVVASLTATPFIAVAADPHDTAHSRRERPGNGATEVATQPPVAPLPVPRNTADRIRALHPEALLAVAVGTLLAISVVLSILMIRDALGRPYAA